MFNISQIQWFSQNARVDIYEKGRRRSYDEVVAIFISLSGLNVGLEVFTSGGVSKISRDESHTLLLYGRVATVSWNPFPLFSALSKDSWPERLHVAFLPPVVPQAGRTFELRNPGYVGFINAIVGAAFVRYFESLRPDIEKHFGTEVSTWPMVCNFARVVRNACAHGGKIFFQNPKATAVMWQGVQIGPNDNGKTLFSMQDFIGYGDVVLLMEELDMLIT